MTYLTLAEKMEIGGLWDLMVMFYVLIQLFMFASYIRADWAKRGQPMGYHPLRQRQESSEEDADSWTQKISFHSSDGRPKTEPYHSAYEEAKGTIRRHKQQTCGGASPTNGTYTSVYYDTGGSERITFFSAIQMQFEPIQNPRRVAEAVDRYKGAGTDSLASMENGDDNPPTAVDVSCWRITGQGNDSDGSFVISEGFVVASGSAYWIEEPMPLNHLSSNSSNSTQNTTNNRALILNRGKFDFADHSFTGTWISNTVGAVERPHHPDFRLQQTYELAKRHVIQNFLVHHQQQQQKEPPPTVAQAQSPAHPSAAAAAERGLGSRNCPRASSLASFDFCPVFTIPPTSGLYRCTYLEKGVFVSSTMRLSFQPYHHHEQQQELNHDQINGINSVCDNGNSTKSHWNQSDGDFHHDEMLWEILGNGTNSLGMSFTIAEGLVSAKNGKAYWVEQEQLPHHSSHRQLQPTNDHPSDHNGNDTPDRRVLSSGTFSFLVQDFAGWRQRSNDALSCRFQEFCLLREEQRQGLENQKGAHQPSTSYETAYEQAKSRVKKDIAGLVCSPSVSGYYYDDACTPTSGTYTFSYHNPHDKTAVQTRRFPKGNC